MSLYAKSINVSDIEEELRYLDNKPIRLIDIYNTNKVTQIAQELQKWPLFSLYLLKTL
jgi:hypothetical protein